MINRAATHCVSLQESKNNLADEDSFQYLNATEYAQENFFLCFVVFKKYFLWRNYWNLNKLILQKATVISRYSWIFVTECRGWPRMAKSIWFVIMAIHLHCMDERGPSTDVINEMLLLSTYEPQFSILWKKKYNLTQYYQWTWNSESDVLSLYIRPKWRKYGRQPPKF